MKNHKTLTDIEREVLEHKIDLKFENSILQPRKEAIVNFLLEIQKSNFEYKISDRVKQIEVISLYYYANSPLSFLFAQPCYAFYDDNSTVILELHLDNYTIFDNEELCKAVLAENNIDYSDIEEKLDYIEFWDNQSSMEIKFILDCWQKAKEISKSKLIGFLDSSDSSGETYDLDNEECFCYSDITIKEYLKNKGIKINNE